MSAPSDSRRRRRRRYDDPKVMEFWEHLEELRWVIFKSLIAVTIGTAICLTFTSGIYRILLFPLATIADSRKIVLRYDGPLDAFLIKLKMGVLGGVVLAAPAVFYFVWTFVAPGLLERERRAVRTALAAGFGFFLAGVAFGYYLLTLVLPILLKFSDPGVQNLWRLKTYMDFAFRLLLGVGAAFELPVVLTVLVRLGILDVKKLQKGRPYAVVITMTVAAILTPPDPFTQLMLGIPMILLYEISVLAAKWQERVLARQRAEDGDGGESREAPEDDSQGDGPRPGTTGPAPGSETPESEPGEADFPEDGWEEDPYPPYDVYAPDEDFDESAVSGEIEEPSSVTGPGESPEAGPDRNPDAGKPMENPDSGDTVKDVDEPSRRSGNTPESTPPPPAEPPDAARE